MCNIFADSRTRTPAKIFFKVATGRRCASFAPNGAVLIYAGRDRGQGVLATISVDGQVSLRLKSDQGEVREPVWGPFAN